MQEAAIRSGLSPAEWRLVLALREVPESVVREELASLVADLVDFAREPHCREMQADGVPCLSARTSCEDCQQVLATLRGLRRRLFRA
jgi:hypothetical protein